MVAPTWYRIAESYIGEREIKGPENNPKIVSWLRDLNAKWREDETPWCGTFVAHCMKKAGYPIPSLWFRAKAWINYGTAIPRGIPIPMGAIMVFTRDGGGHIGFYTKEESDVYCILGGNQCDGVCINPYPKSRCLDVRWVHGLPYEAFINN